MFTYVVTMFCDGDSRHSILVSETKSTVDEAIADVVKKAKEYGWQRVKTKWFCDECVTNNIAAKDRSGV